MADPIWCVMPILAGPAMTEAAIGDLLAQSVPTRLLLINQGVDDAFRDRLERLAEQEPERIFLWSHQPPLPSLSASWNRALNFVWSVGGEVALVVNNDVRLDADTIRILDKALFYDDALFVSAVGVTVEQFDARPKYSEMHGLSREFFVGDGPFVTKGGPDFSCFLISRAAHWKYPFDERFVPAYGEDCDTHRRYMLGGDAARIFSINLPYLHYASGTLKQLPPKEREELERRIGGSRAYYAQKWGPDGINGETFTIPFDVASARGGVTNPELQRRGGVDVSDVGATADGVPSSAILDSTASS